MADDKKISRDAYVWGHFATILFHTFIAVFLIYLSYAKVGKGPGSYSMDTYRRILFITGVVLLIFSLGALMPVFQDYEETKEVIIKKN